MSRTFLRDMILLNHSTRRSNLGVFQISGIMADRAIRTAGFLSMAFAFVSVLYSVVLVVYFSNLRRDPSGTVEDGNADQRTRSVVRFPTHDWTTVSERHQIIVCWSHK
jgi:hypothetical protein